MIPSSWRKPYNLDSLGSPGLSWAPWASWAILGNFLAIRLIEYTCFAVFWAIRMYAVSFPWGLFRMRIYAVSFPWGLFRMRIYAVSFPWELFRMRIYAVSFPWGHAYVRGFLSLGTCVNACVFTGFGSLAQNLNNYIVFYQFRPEFEQKYRILSCIRCLESNNCRVCKQQRRVRCGLWCVYVVKHVYFEAS